MEDFFSVAYQEWENKKDLEYAFVGIYDGHGGAEAAKFARQHLIKMIVRQKLFWSKDDHDILQAIREGYIATHYAMWKDQGERGVGMGKRDFTYYTNIHTHTHKCKLVQSCSYSVCDCVRALLCIEISTLQ